jgi:hypothetical protein
MSGAREIKCEECGYAFGRAAWVENKGYCPNCDQPLGKMARENLNLPRADVPDEELPGEIEREDRGEPPGPVVPDD